MVVTWPFISCYFLGVCRTCMRPQATSEAITFEPIKIQTRSASQNDCLNLSFVKDKHTYGKKMARKGPTTVVYQYLSFPIRVYLSKSQWGDFAFRANLQPAIRKLERKLNRVLSPNKKQINNVYLYLDSRKLKMFSN